MHAVRDKGKRTIWLRIWQLTAVIALTSVCATVSQPLNANSTRTISLFNVHTKETLKIAYKRNGVFLPDALKKLNWHLRDWRRNEPIKMDPHLIDLIWAIRTELGSRAPVHVISGYRSPATNAMLRRTRGGQARRSQHMVGKAMDVRFPDIPVRRLRYSALLRQQGGVGYYPTSATPFVHIDTGRVRHWPRMGRQELALLFPNGQTRHRPRRGGPITRRDFYRAKQSNSALAQRVAAFYANRRNGPGGSARRTRIAAATKPRAIPAPRIAPAPRLLRAPRPVEAPRRVASAATPRYWPAPRVARASVPAPSRRLRSRQEALRRAGWNETPRPAPRKNRSASPPARVAALFQETRPAVRPKTRAQASSSPAPMPFRPPAPATYTTASIDHSGLARLASAIFGSSSSNQAPAPKPVIAQPKPDDWISAPAFDEEHPEELFYRPFPIAPYITLTASADDLALRQMRAPTINKTLLLLVEDGADVDSPLQLRPSTKVANLMWSQSFKESFKNGKTPPQPPTHPSRQQAGSWPSRPLVQLAGR